MSNVSYNNETATSNQTRVEHLTHGTRSEQIFRIVSELGLAFPLAMLGIVGNILALIVLGKHKHRMTTTVVLQALAVADTLVLISTILLRSFRYIVKGYMFTLFYHVFFRYMYPTVFWLRLTDTYLTVLLTIDRYIAVCHPLHATRLCTLKRSYLSMLGIVVISIAFCIPRYFEHDLKFGIHPTTNETRLFFYFTMINTNRYYVIGYQIIAHFLVMYLVPMILLVILNSLLLLALRKAQKQRAAMQFPKQDADGSSLNNRTVTIIVVTVVAVCITCNVAAMLSHILWAITHTYDEYKDTLNAWKRYISNISNVLVTLNSAVNFIIYCFSSRKFRLILKNICICQKRQRRPLGSLNRDNTALTKRGHSTWSSGSSNYTQSFRLANHDAISMKLLKSDSCDKH